MVAVVEEKLNKDDSTIRVDSAQSRTSVARLDCIEYTSQGYLKAKAFITRVGVFTYRKEDGTVVRELRLPEEVFSQESLDTLNNIPLTDNHPPEMLSAANTKKYQRGYLFGDVGIEADTYVQSSVLVTDADVIRKIQNGLDQLSAGYSADIEYISGVHPLFGEYDAIQRNIRYNHVSRVDMGRAGNEVRVRFDAMEMEEGYMPKKVDRAATLAITDDPIGDRNDGCCDAAAINDMCSGRKVGDMFMFTGKEDGNTFMYRVKEDMSHEKVGLVHGSEGWNRDMFMKDMNMKKGDGAMPTIKLDGVEIQVSEAAALALNAELQRKDSAYEALKTERDQLEAQRDQYKADAATATEELETVKRVDVSAMVAETVKAMADAKPFLPQDSKLDGLNATEIKTLAIGNVYPDLDLSEKSEVYISARFDALVEQPSNPDYSQAFSQQIINQVPAVKHDSKDEGEYDQMAAFNEMAADLQNAGNKGE